MTPMSDMAELQNSFLLRQFNAFYEIVIREKTAAGKRRGTLDLFRPEASAPAAPEIPLPGNLPFTDGEQSPSEHAASSTVDGNATGQGDGMSRIRSETNSDDKSVEKAEKATADPIWHRLHAVLEQQVVEARSRGGEYGVAFYREAQFVMAALADELFIHMDWEGRRGWKSHLLEYRLFGTHNAGQRFFQRIDELLKAGDPAYAEVAGVYLQALSLGFRGKFRDTDDKGMLTFYRRQLFQLIFQRNPEVSDSDRPLFSQPAGHTLTKGDGGDVSSYRWWGIGFAAAVLVLLILSHLIWSSQTAEIQEIVQQIIKDVSG